MTTPIITSPAFATAIESLRKPIQYFLDHGFWDPYVGGHEYVCGGNSKQVSDATVRKLARGVAREQKRPFIQCHATYRTFTHVEKGKNAAGLPIWEWEKHPPKFSTALVAMPKNKYLADHVAPLLLTGNNDWRAPVYDKSGVTLWEFQINSKELWDEYFAHVMNDPALRAARGAPPLS